MWPNTEVLRLSCYFFTRNTIIPNPMSATPSRLTHTVKHVDPQLWLFPTLTCTHYISFKMVKPKPPWKIIHTSRSRNFSSKVLSAHTQQFSLFTDTLHSNHSSNFNSPNLSSNNVFTRDVKSNRSWMPSIYSYLGSFTWLLPPSFQVTVASFSIVSAVCLEIWCVF